MPPHRHRRSHEGTAAIGRDQQRAHVTRDEHRADQHADDEQQRRKVAQHRDGRRPGARQALGQRCAAQEEEPGRADDEPDAADLGSELAQVRQAQAEGQHPDRGEPTQQRQRCALASALRHTGQGIASACQAASEGTRQRLAQAQHDAEQQQPEPEVALVVEREVAVDGMAIGREFEQHDGAQAAQQHQAGEPGARAHALRWRACARRFAQQRPGAKQRSSHQQCHDESGRRTAEVGARACGFETAPARKRPRNARRVGRHGPGRQRHGDTDGRTRRSAAAARPQQERISQCHRAGPLHPGVGHQRAHCGVLALVGLRLSCGSKESGTACQRGEAATHAGVGCRIGPAHLRRQRSGAALAVERRGVKQHRVSTVGGAAAAAP